MPQHDEGPMPERKTANAPTRLLPEPFLLFGLTFGTDLSPLIM